MASILKTYYQMGSDTDKKSDSAHSNLLFFHFSRCPKKTAFSRSLYSFVFLSILGVSVLQYMSVSSLLM